MAEDCMVVTWFASDQPGFLDFSYRIAALAKVYRVSVVSTKPLTQAELLIPGIEYIVIPQQENRTGWLMYLLTCSRLIRKRRPSRVVLLHSLLTPLCWLMHGTPNALYWNEHPSRFTASPPNHPYIKRLARKLSLKWAFYEAARRADLVMPIGESHYQDLIEHGFHPGQVKLLHMGVDEQFSHKPSARERCQDASPLQLIYVGTVSKARGRDVMLEALAQANRETTVAHLTIIGASDDELGYCSDYAQRLGIADAVHLFGRLPGAAIPAILRTKDAGLCLWEDKPWWRFNPPTKLFEYLVAGLPVLASDIRTHTHYISNGYNGLIFHYAPENLAAAIHMLWQHRANLPLLKRHAYETGRRYRWPEIEPHFLQAMEALPAAHQWQDGTGEGRVQASPR